MDNIVLSSKVLACALSSLVPRSPAGPDCVPGSYGAGRWERQQEGNGYCHIFSLGGFTFFEPFFGYTSQEIALGDQRFRPLQRPERPITHHIGDGASGEFVLLGQLL